MAGSPTQLAKLAFGIVDPVTMVVNFWDFDPGVAVEMQSTAGTTGQYDKPDELMVENFVRVRPRLSAQPTAVELAFYLAWGMWGTPSGSGTVSYPIGDTPAERTMHWKPKLGEQIFSPSVVCNRFTLRASVGEPLSAELELIGKTYDDARTDFPAGLDFDRTTRPFTLNRLALVCDGVTTNTREFALSVFHAVDEERFLNSLTLTDYVKDDQVLTLALDVPTAAGLWKKARTAGFSVVGTFTNGFGGTLTITMGKFRAAVVGPTHPAKGEGFQRWEGELYQTSTNRPLTTTLVTGP